MAGDGSKSLGRGKYNERKKQNMWTYEKKLQYPVKIKNPNPAMAKLIISQLGGPDGELGASMRYLNQRYSMPWGEVVGILNDVGTEEEIKKSGFDTYFVDHTTGVYPIAASGVPYDMKYIGVKGDVLADLNEDLAAEQKARVTYDNLLRLIDDPDVCDPIKFLREREIVHYQRFGDALRVAQDNMDSKNFYGYNPAFDKRSARGRCE